MREKVIDGFSTACINDEASCPYHGGCNRRKNDVIVHYADIRSPKDIRNFALWNITNKSKVWFKDEDGMYRFYSCQADDSPCYYEELEKQIIDEFIKKVSQKVKAVSRDLNEFVQELKVKK